MKKLKDAIRQKTNGNNGHSLTAVIDQVNRTLRGWFEYFKHCHMYIFKPLDKWICRWLRNILRKCSELEGLSEGLDHYRWHNKYFQDLGLYGLVEAHRALFQSS